MLRITPVVWIAPFLTLLAVAYANIFPDATSDPYPLALTATGAISVIWVAPICAACAAWEGERLRRAGWFVLPHVRRIATVVFTSLVIVLFVGFVSLGAAVAFKFLKADVVTVPDLRVMLVAFLVIISQVLLGFAIGVRVPTVIAVPMALIVTYGWILLSAALSPPWLQHLTGVWTTCCSLETDLAWEAVAGSSIVACGFAGSAFALLRQPFNFIRVVVSLAPVTLGFTIGAVLVNDLGTHPVVARDASVLICSSEQPRVCVWPEHRARLEEVNAILFRASDGWLEAGVKVPEEFSEYNTFSQHERNFGFSLEASQYDILNSLAYSMLPSAPQCAIDGTRPYFGAITEDYVLAWLDATAGMPALELRRRFDFKLPPGTPNILTTVADVRSLPPERQLTWLETNINVMRGCDVEPTDKP